MLLRFNELFFPFGLGEAFLALGVGLVENEGIETAAAIVGSIPVAGAVLVAGAAGSTELMVSLLLPGTRTMMATENPIIVAPIITKGA